MQYGFKEVPDIFFCWKDSNVVQYDLTNVIAFSYYCNEDGFYLTIKNSTFDPAVLSVIEDYISNYNMYFRSYKRNVKIGKDEPFCMKFEKLEFIESEFECRTDGDPSIFTYKIFARTKSLIEDDECPNNDYIRLSFKNGSTLNVVTPPN